MQRFIIEMGMGNDLHGQDYTKAAARAIEDAIRHSSIPLFGALGLDHGVMQVRVTVGVQTPEALDTDALKARLPRGQVSVVATEGGLDVTNPDTGEVTVIATAAVEAFLDPGTVRDAAQNA
ncbi:MAG: Lin0512 family protein [Pseudomonadota bacterium]